jgi:hypothetical protein
MNPLFACAAEVQEYCRSRDWGFCIVGGIVVMRWSGHRTTKDVDLVIVTPFGEEATLIDGLYGRFEAAFEDSREVSARTRVLKFITSNGVMADVALGRSRRLLRMVARASLWEVEGGQLLTCSAEDLIVNKALSGRPKDWADVEEVIARQGSALDADLVMREFIPVLQQSHHLADPLAQLQRNDHDEAIELLEKLLSGATLEQLGYVQPVPPEVAGTEDLSHA